MIEASEHRRSYVARRARPQQCLSLSAVRGICGIIGVSIVGTPLAFTVERRVERRVELRQVKDTV